MALCSRVTAAERKNDATSLQSVMDPKQICHYLAHVQYMKWFFTLTFLSPGPLYTISCHGQVNLC